MNQNGTYRRERSAAIVWATLLFFGVWAVYLVTAYGGIRSPDAEVQYRATAGLYHQGWPVVADNLEQWPGFGVAGGWSIFGPLQPIAALPSYGAGQVLGPRVAEHWPWSLPASHFVGDSLKLLSWGADPLAPDSTILAAAGEAVAPISPSAYGERMVTVLLFGPFWGALGVVLLFGAALDLGATRPAAVAASLAFGLATLHWHYAGTFFSESLATALVTASLWAMVARSRWTALLSGLFLGMAVLAHISAILFVPFFGMGVMLAYGVKVDGAVSWRRAAEYTAGLAPMLGLLAWWNFYRFGHVLETGRSVDQAAATAFGYGNWQWPASEVLALLVSPANGLLVLCPIVLLGAWGAWRLRRTHGWLVVILGAAVFFRLLFIGARSDWHGGFALGPRYMVMCLPLLMLPTIAVFEGPKPLRYFGWAAVVLAALQQWLHVLGEPFLALHRTRWMAQVEGREAGLDHAIHVATYTPLLYWPGPVEIGDAWVYWPSAWGPFWLQGSVYSWWVWAGAGALVLGAAWLCLVCYVQLRKDASASSRG